MMSLFSEKRQCQLQAKEEDYQFSTQAEAAAELTAHSFLGYTAGFFNPFSSPYRVVCRVVIFAALQTSTFLLLLTQNNT
jgi:hypothetical protein